MIREGSLIHQRRHSEMQTHNSIVWVRMKAYLSLHMTTAFSVCFQWNWGNTWNQHPEWNKNKERMEEQEKKATAVCLWTRPKRLMELCWILANWEDSKTAKPRGKREESKETQGIVHSKEVTAVGSEKQLKVTGDGGRSTLRPSQARGKDRDVKWNSNRIMQEAHAEEWLGSKARRKYADTW